jgi:hypothetical protein
MRAIPSLGAGSTRQRRTAVDSGPCAAGRRGSAATGKRDTPLDTPDCTSVKQAPLSIGLIHQVLP